MIVGLLKEIKNEEHRVAITPAGVELLTGQGHTVLVEKNAGHDSGFEDNQYREAGAEIVETNRDIYGRAGMVMHVKEIQPEEYGLLKKGQIVFTYLHLAAEEGLTNVLAKSDAVCIAYETIQNADGSLPLLTPMSEVAGRMAIQEAAKYLEMSQGGRGVLLGGVPGVAPAMVVILGGGIVGINAAKMACGLGARVYVVDRSLDRLRYLSDVMPANCICLMSNPANIRELVRRADVVIGAVLVPGALSPKLLTREMVGMMKKGSVVVDVAIDQGGCFETSRPTSHTHPVYRVDDVIHYCVTNMPGAVARTSTLALTNATLPYALDIANKGWKKAMEENRAIRAGANVVMGKITHPNVAEAFGMPYTPIETLL